MKIILVIHDMQRRNLVFVTDTLKVYALPEAARAVQSGQIPLIHIVKTGAGSHLRANPNASARDNLDFVAYSSRQLYDAIDGAAFVSGPGLRRYWEVYSKSLEQSGLEKDAFIWINGKRRTTREHVIAILHAHRDLIHAAAARFGIDPYLLGGIMIDETARMAAFEEIRDAVASFVLDWNVSVGVAQVKLRTAKGLIRDGYYNPDPTDPGLSRKRVNGVSRTHLYQYAVQPQHSIFFAAAHIRALVDKWESAIDLLGRPAIIATLYHLSYRAPHGEPGTNDRGMQIIREFYPLAKSILFRE